MIGTTQTLRMEDFNVILEVGQRVLHADTEWIIAGPEVDAQGQIGVLIHAAEATDEQIENCEVPTVFVRDLSSLTLVESVIAA